MVKIKNFSPWEFKLDFDQNQGNGIIAKLMGNSVNFVRKSMPIIWSKYLCLDLFFWIIMFSLPVGSGIINI